MKSDEESPARDIVGRAIFQNIEMGDCTELTDNEFNVAWSSVGGGRGLMADFLRGSKQ